MTILAAINSRSEPRERAVTNTNPGRNWQVHAISATASKGRLTAGHRGFYCNLGATGRRPLKREGDGAGPFGRCHPQLVLYRADRTPRPLSQLPVRQIRPDDCWSDDPEDRRYNMPVNTSSKHRYERLWRRDSLYDLLIVLDLNQRTCRRNCGSAIFIHLTGERATAGCIALAERDLRQLIAGLTTTSSIDFGQNIANRHHSGL